MNKETYVTKEINTNEELRNGEAVAKGLMQVLN